MIENVVGNCLYFGLWSHHRPQQSYIPAPAAPAATLPENEVGRDNDDSSDNDNTGMDENGHIVYEGFPGHFRLKQLFADSLAGLDDDQHGLEVKFLVGTNMDGPRLGTDRSNQLILVEHAPSRLVHEELYEAQVTASSITVPPVIENQATIDANLVAVMSSLGVVAPSSSVDSVNDLLRPGWKLAATCSLYC